MDERERHARAKDVFLAVKGVPPRRRAALLGELCGEDGALRAEVETLLRFDSGGGPLDATHAAGTPVHGMRTGVEFLGPEASLGEASPPPDLLRTSVHRLRTVALLLPATIVVLWLVPVTLRGQLLREFRQPAEWVPPTLAIVASLLILVAVRASRSNRRVLDFGLAYLVAVSFALAWSQYWTAFEGFPPEAIDFDVLGFSGAALWILLFSILVPTRPRRALPALLAAAAAPPVVYGLSARFSTAPALPAGRFFLSIVLPQLVVVVLAYVAVRIVYGLGLEVSKARRVGSYHLESPLAEGGMGSVWRARHRLLARPAAVKLIRREAFGDRGALERALERFEHEARATASLRSLHTVELYDFGVAGDGSLYYAMELLDGLDLDRMVRRWGPLDPARAVHLFRQACLSLAEAHAEGLTHRDVKPANLFVCRHGFEDDVLKTLDFGLARPSRISGRDRETSYPLEGTPAFMAPESATAGTEPDERADLYSLGCTLYWALTGEPVFEAETVEGVLRAHAHQTPTPPSVVRPGLPASLDTITLRCLAKKRGDRFQKALELDAALEATGLEVRWTREAARRWWEGMG